MTTGLLLVAALHGDGLADGLAISDLRVLEHGLRAELGQQLLADDLKLQLALAADQRFERHRVLRDDDVRHFLAQARQAGEHLVLLARLLRVHRQGHLRRREVDAVILHDLADLAQAVAGGGVLQLGERADVARAEHADRRLLLAADHEQAARLFRLVGVGVVERGRRRQDAGDDLDERQLAHERVGDRLEHLRGEALAHVRVADVHRLGLRVDAVIGVLHRGGHVHRQRIEQRAHADAVQAGNRRDRHDAAVVDAGGQAAQHLLVGEGALVEELLHQLLAGGRRGLVAGLKGFVDHRLHVVGNRNLAAILARAGKRLAAEHVDDAAEGRALADGQHHRDDAGAVLGAQFVEHLAVIDMFTINLGDGDEAGKAMLPGLVPCLFKAGGNSGHGAHDDHGALHRVQRAGHFAREVEVTRNINEIELLAVDFNRRHGRADGDMALDLFGIIVTDSVAVLDTALAIGHAGSIEHRLNQRRLAFRAVSQYSDVAYVLYHIVLHNRSSFCRFAAVRRALLARAWLFLVSIISDCPKIEKRFCPFSFHKADILHKFLHACAKHEKRDGSFPPVPGPIACEVRKAA